MRQGRAPSQRPRAPQRHAQLPPERPQRTGLGIAAALAVALVGIAGFIAVHYLTRLHHAGPPRQAALSRSTSTPRSTPTSTPSASPSPPPPPPTGQTGDFRVTSARYTFAEHPLSGGPVRILHVIVWFPAGVSGQPTAAGRFPLIAFAPGFKQCAGQYTGLLRGWASAGYVVAGINFPVTSCEVAHPYEPDLPHQPGDVAYVIQRMLAFSEHPGDRLTGLVDADRIGAAGHSDGGDAVAAMAAATCCQDPSLRAVVVLAGAESPWPVGNYFTSPVPPMLFVQGTADGWNPPSASVKLYQADTRGPRYYLDLFGANHFAPYQGSAPPEPEVERVTLDFFDHYLAGLPVSIDQMRKAGRVPGVAGFGAGGRVP